MTISPDTPVPGTDPDGNESPEIKTEYKFSHVTTQRYLPTPGKAPGWPFAFRKDCSAAVSSTNCVVT